MKTQQIKGHMEVEMDSRIPEELLADISIEEAQPMETPEMEPQEEEAFYRSQSEIDSAIGKRLKQERERWERKHAAGLLLEKAMGGLSVNEAAAVLLARANGLDEQDVFGLMEENVGFTDILPAARQRSLSRQAEAISGGDPEFSLDQAMRDPAFRALIEAGEPLERAYAYRNMDRRIESERQHARDDIMRSIQRKGLRPSALRPGGAGMGGHEEFLPDSLIRVIDEKLKRGEKVRI